MLNEVGDGNVILFHDLNSQFAAFMVKHFNDKDLKNAIRRLVSEEIARTNPDRGTIGNNVKIINTREITNTVIQDDCEISGASRLSDCTILSSENASVFIGTGVICENSIISDGSSIVNSVKMQDCFVGEACQIANGFTASQSVFFAHSWQTVRLVLPSAVLSVHRITRAHYSSVVCSPSIMQDQEPTSLIMRIRWDQCTGEYWNVVRRMPVVAIC